jgi:flagellin
MANDVTLSTSVRSNLLSLQNTADLLARTQERLSTGKKVNSALDNPTNFFTASSLSARSGDLNSLLDGISNGIQALDAADQGISSITKLVESAQATARQALQTASGDVAYNTITYGSVAVAADDAATVTGVVNLRDDATDYDTASATGITTITDDTIADLAGETLTLSYGTDSFSFTFGTGSGQVDDLAEFNVQLGAAATAVGGGASFAVTAGALTLSGDTANVTDSIMLKGTSSNALSTLGFAPEDTSSPIVEIQADNLLKELDLKNGDTLTFQLGEEGATQTVVFGTGAGQVNSRSGLETALQALSSLDAANTIVDGARIKVTAADAENKLIIGGSAREEIFGASVLSEGINGNIPQNTISQTNADLSLLEGQQLSIQLGDGSTTNITLGTTNGRVSSRADLLEKINAISTDLTASFDTVGRLKFQSTSKYDLKISGNGASALGVQQKAYSPTATVNTTSKARESLQADFNYTLSQITTLAQDASYNGVNLLTKDNLSITFNENGSSQLNIQGVDFTMDGLGLTDADGNDFQKDSTINDMLDKLGGALTTLRTQASKFGSNLAIVETRQDFTKNLINVLDTGASNLTLADSTEEAANALALQTRQSLATTSLSLSNQADQSILQLF